MQGASLVAQTIKNPPSMWETGAQSLGWGDPLEKGQAKAGDIRHTAWIPGSGRPPGGGPGNPLQYSFLENPMDRGAWLQSVRSQSRTRLTEVT